MFPNGLLPDPATLEIETIDMDDQQCSLVLNLKSTQTSNHCPLCQTRTEHVHSRYLRTLVDLPWADWQVSLVVEVRRFFCHHATCRRWIFTERMPEVAAPWARRTTRVADVQREVGLAVGASMGARLMEALHLPSEDDVVLCLVRQVEPAAVKSVRVLGVDDWAMRKGRTYGTILVDLEKGEPIEVLPDRTAETLAAWLKQHPEIEIISRDRAGAYAEGAKQGAPQALQIADRWHLLKNLGDALVKILTAYQRPLGQLAPSGRDTPGSAVPLLETAPTSGNTPEPAVNADQRPLRPAAQHRQEQRRAARYARFQEVRDLAHNGATISAIARQTGLDRKTVRKFIEAPTCPEPQPRLKRGSILDPYKAYVRQRWDAGCRTAIHLWRELQALGFTGGRMVVVDFVAQLRREQGVVPYSRMLSPHADTSPLTPRTATWLIMKRPADPLDENDQRLVAQIRQLHPDLDAAITLVQDFATLLRKRLSADLDTWLDRADTSALPALRSFAAGIRRDYEAVKAAASLEWSNGPVEGQVNRLKFIKRQMFGRANFDLLRRRVLYIW
jgi:transposase